MEEKEKKQREKKMEKLEEKRKTLIILVFTLATSDSVYNIMQRYTCLSNILSQKELTPFNNVWGKC